MISRTKRLWLLIGIPAALVLLPLAAYGVDRAVGSGEIARNVTVDGVDVGGLSEQDALDALGAHKEAMRARTATFVVEGDTYALAGSTVDLDFDEASAIAEALTRHRAGGFGDIEAWFGSFRSTEAVTVDHTVSADAVESAAEGFERQSIDDPAFDGQVVVTGGVAVAEYPRPGRRVARDGLVGVVLEALTSAERLPVTLGIESVSPTLTDGDVDAAVEEANLLISEPIVLAAADPDISILFTSSSLADALRSDVVTNSPSEIRLWFDEEAVEAVLRPYLSQINTPPRDAAFVIAEEGGIEIAPSRSGTKLDTAQIASVLDEAARRTGRTAVFPFAEGDSPTFSTEDAEAMGPLTKVSEYTTNHPCCQSRVTNIHLFADTVDGAVVWPGEVFSLNERVGERTTEKGYVAAPAIQAGELIDAIGGGVSQFATTFYNAVFFGCYEDVDHKPHSQYFSRYPVVREATLNWPSVDLKFRNDSESVVVIDTKYTDRSITVEFWGNNGGRTCTSETSGRYGYRDPTTEYIPDPELDPGGSVVEDTGLQGWSARVTRFMEMPDGNITEQEWTWGYVMKPIKLRIHPCEIPEGDPAHTGEECPLEVLAVVGLTVADGIAALEAQGFVVTVATPIDVSDPAQEGIIQTQDLTGFALAGTVVTITPGVYVEPPPEEPPPDEGS